MSWVTWLFPPPTAATFMEHWKRKQMRLRYHWDLTGFEEEEVSRLVPTLPGPCPFSLGLSHQQLPGHHFGVSWSLRSRSSSGHVPGFPVWTPHVWHSLGRLGGDCCCPHGRGPNMASALTPRARSPPVVGPGGGVGARPFLKGGQPGTVCLWAPRGGAFRSEWPLGWQGVPARGLLRRSLATTPSLNHQLRPECPGG